MALNVAVSNRAMNQKVQRKLDSYPELVRLKVIEIRGIIFSVAEECGLDEIDESLKWGELSYASKVGSPIRIDWKQKNPERISLYVNCKTVLIETFKEIYGDVFEFVGNREVILPISEPLPLPELKGCISMALMYHKLKKLPLLGA